MADLQYWDTVLVIVSVVGLAVVSLIFVLRLLSRQMSRQKLDIGDCFMGIGLLFCYGVAICNIIGRTINPFAFNEKLTYIFLQLHLMGLGRIYGV